MYTKVPMGWKVNWSSKKREIITNTYGIPEVVAEIIPNKDQDDNAYLISSAPKMYEAINEYIKHYDSNETNEEVKRWLDREGIPMFRQILKENNIINN